MVQTSFALMTNVGRAKEAAALANGTTINVTQIAIGDGSTVPSGGETALYNEIARKSITGHGTVVGSSNVAYFDAYLTAAEGPYTIREAGLFDDTGALIAIAYYNPPISKPIPSSGQTVEGTIRLEVAFSNVANITIVVDPSFLVALQRLSRLPWIPVISMTTMAPPGSPAVGDCYLIPTGATGSWSGNAGKIAEYTTAGWAMITAAEGHGISLPDGRVFEKISGAYTEKLALDAQSGKWSYIAGGSANALTATLVPAPAALTPRMAIRLTITTPNTGGATLNVNGLGAVGIVRSDLTGLLNNDLTAGTTVELIYNGSSWQLVGLLNTTKPFYQGVAAAGGTLTFAQIGSVVQFGVGAGAFAVNLPLSSTCPNGGRINFFHNGNNPVTLQVQGSDQIGYADGTLSSSIIVNTGDTLELLCLGVTGTWLVIDGSMGNRAASDFKQSLAANGWKKLPGGYIEMWGSGTGSASGGVNITLPSTFPTAAYSLVMTAQGASAASVSAYYNSLTTSGFTAVITLNGAFASLPFTYRVVGR